MRVIFLTQGQHTVVDDAVFEWASQHEWHVKKTDCTFYAARTIRLPDGKQSVSFLHREIMKADKGVEVDHRDGNGLNNRGSNLRLCSGVENSQNRSMRRDNASGYKGVSLHKRAGKWQAQLQIAGQYKYLGLFDQAIDAACAYDTAALAAFGEFARLNFPIVEVAV